MNVLLGVVFFALALSVTILVVLGISRKLGGERSFQISSAALKFALVLGLNCMMLLTTITWTTTVLSSGLHIGGQVTQNVFLKEFFSLPSMSSNFAILIPLVTVVCAHCFVASANYAFRLIPTLFAASQNWLVSAVEGSERNVESNSTKNSIMSRLVLTKICGNHPIIKFVVASASAYLFWILYQSVLALEVSLLQWQFIKSSKELVQQRFATSTQSGKLPADWASIPLERLNLLLDKSVAGRLIEHVGVFYGVLVVICAILMVRASETFWLAIVKIKTVSSRLQPPAIQGSLIKIPFEPSSASRTSEVPPPTAPVQKPSASDREHAASGPKTAMSD